ncbi:MULTISPECIES: hypothetical protein [Providencia]|jgi:hypothetical protein|uniref:hypothetical protein n=1 Tax=Providencia TaxID=586 RepID=UPI001C5B3DA9|nr:MULTISPECIES: hypothetical protein [Providencia]ELR5149404.1 hypothetical protein [Providencia rettgeri]MDR2224416.1 hypothetical protein [Providencia sp.]QXX83603.1 hypothetical protein J6836_04205 [Providencia sp. R33]
MRKFVILLFLPLLLLACTKEKPSLVIISGISKAEVIHIEGTPMSSAKQDQYDLLFYADQLLPDQPDQKADRIFIFVDNRLMEYSTMNIRSVHDKSSEVRLNAKQSLACWINQLNLPVNPSATANQNTKTHSTDCFSEHYNQ